MHDIPPSLEESILEARKSLDIGNYKSSIVMSRRAVEGLLKFAHKRLLGTDEILVGLHFEVVWLAERILFSFLSIHYR